MGAVVGAGCGRRRSERKAKAARRERSQRSDPVERCESCRQSMAQFDAGRHAPTGRWPFRDPRGCHSRRQRRPSAPRCYPIAITAPRASRGASLRMSRWRNRDAAGRRGQAGPREVEENRAAAALGAPRIILVEHEGQVIEMIVAPHPVGAIGGGQAHGAIVTRARRVLAPALVAAHGLERHARGARSRTVRPVIAPQEPEPPRRRPLVALALDPDNSRRSERAREAERARP